VSHALEEPTFCVCEVRAFEAHNGASKLYTPQGTKCTKGTMKRNGIFMTYKLPIRGTFPLNCMGNLPLQGCLSEDFNSFHPVKGTQSRPFVAIGHAYDWWRKCKDREQWKTTFQVLLNVPSPYAWKRVIIIGQNILSLTPTAGVIVA